MADQRRWVVAAVLPEGVTVYLSATYAGRFGSFSDAFLFPGPGTAELQAADARGGEGDFSDIIPTARAIEVTVPEPVYE